MRWWSTKHKRLFISFLAVCIIFQSLFAGVSLVQNRTSSVVPQAYAGWPVFDWFQGILQSIWKYLEENVWPAVRDLAAKRITDYITQETIKYINNGEKPTYVSDWKSFVNKSRDIAFDSINRYLEDDGLDLCAPYQFQLGLQLQALRYQNQQMPVTCTYDDFKRNIDRTTDFVRSGGWLAYDALYSTDVNPYWLSLKLEDSYNSKVAEEAESRVNEALSSSGFLGQKQCTKYNDGTTWSEISGACDGDNACIAAYEQEVGCAKTETQTPGDVVAKSMDNVIKSDTWWGTNIQSMVSAIVNALVSKLFEKGMSSLTESDVDADSSVQIGSQDLQQWNALKSQLSQLYEDMIFYYDSNEAYPALGVWQAAQNIAGQGSLAGGCSDTATWTQKYNEISMIVAGLSTMLIDARENLAHIESVDPTALNSTQMLQQVNSINTAYNAFSSLYDSLVSQMQDAKAEGDMTETQKVGLQEYEHLTEVFTPPACGSPYVTSE